MFQNLTLNSILIICFGLILIFLGVWTGVSPGGRVPGAGLFFTGLGTAILGLTNGFTDFSPLGRFLYRIALIAFIIGIPVTVYYLYLLVSRG